MSNPKQATWETMEAGHDLDRVIIDKLGVYSNITELHHLLFGERPGRETDKPGNIDGRGMVVVSMREYSTDLNDAFTLFSTELGLQWNLFSDFDDWITCELGHWSETGHIDEQVQASEKTPALAIVKAWLRWQERTDHPAPELKD